MKKIATHSGSLAAKADEMTAAKSFISFFLSLAEYIFLSSQLAYVLFWVTRWHVAMSRGRRWCYCGGTMGGARESEEFKPRENRALVVSLL